MKGASSHIAVEEFKQFVKRHPLLVSEVRKKRKTWQQIYEDWVILGEDHEEWQAFKRSESTTGDSANEDTNSSRDTAADLLSMLKKVDFNDLQHHLSQFSGIISQAQNVLQHFQGGPNRQQQEQSHNPNHPFGFRKD